MSGTMRGADGRSYAHVFSLLFGTPWAILPDKLEAMAEVLELRLQGVTFTAEEIEQRIGGVAPEMVISGAVPSGRLRGQARTAGGVEIIPIHGTISQRAGMFTQVSGGTSMEAISSALKEAVDDRRVKAIALDIDSPGGEVHGTEELAQEIMAARPVKPIVAVANPLAGSGAYYLGSQARRFYGIPTALVGSVGVLLKHVQRAEPTGVKTTLITAGRYKAEGNPLEPLSEEGLEHAQSIVDGFYEMFVEAVARGRGVPVETVKEKYGEGRLYGGKAAQEMGMIDGVKTLEQVVSELEGEKVTSTAAGVASARSGEEEQEGQMTLEEKTIREKLGIDGDADIVEAIEALKVKADASAAQPAASAGSGSASTGSARTGEAGPDPEVTAKVGQLEQQLSEAEKHILALQAENAQTKAQGLVEAAIRDGNLVPRQREYAMKVAIRSEEEFSEYLKTQGKVIEYGERGSGGEYVASDGKAYDLSQFEPTPQQVEISKKAGTWSDPQHRRLLMRENAKAKGVELPMDFLADDGNKEGPGKEAAKA